jgi:hypothetical protein
LFVRLPCLDLSLMHGFLLLDLFAMVRSFGPPEPPRTPPDKHIVGGLSQVRVFWDGGQEEASNEDGQEEDLKGSHKLACIHIVGPSHECPHCC